MRKVVDEPALLILQSCYNGLCMLLVATVCSNAALGLLA